jgi:hypothetical protein
MMDVIWMHPDELRPYPENAKKHPPEQVDHIANSIKQFGWTQPIVVDPENVVVIGHGRLMAAKRLMLDKVPVVRRDDLTEDQITACRLADNKTNESDWDFGKLEEELALLSINDFDMTQFGFENISPDEFGEDFSLAEGEKSPFCQMTFNLASEQAELIKAALKLVGECAETFGNTNRNGNDLYEVVRQWKEQRESS